MKMISRMTSNLWIAFCVISLSGIMTSCKDDDDPQPALEYKTEGYVKGKITGVTRDNSYTFNDDFSYSQYSLLTQAYASYVANTNGSYTITITRADYSTSGTADLSFGLSNAADTTPNAAELDFTYYKEVDNKLVYFSMYSGSGTNTVTITEFTFDSSTGKIKGKYTMSGATNSTTKSATVAGDFEVTAQKLIQ